jgi:carbon-monoxide dehydrogenase small subunit
MKGKTVITLNVNGQPHQVMVRPADLLLDVLREQLGFTGAKPGCRNGDCGACTVIIDGWPAKSCLVLAVEAEGRVILNRGGPGRKSPDHRKAL